MRPNQSPLTTASVQPIAAAIRPLLPLTKQEQSQSGNVRQERWEETRANRLANHVNRVMNVWREAVLVADCCDHHCAVYIIQIWTAVECQNYSLNPHISRGPLGPREI